MYINFNGLVPIEWPEAELPAAHRSCDNYLTASKGRRRRLIEPEISSASIVLVGAFNPRIFNPDWFVVNEILGKSVAATATIEVIVAEIAKIEFETMTLTVQNNRFQIETNQSPYISICDLTVKTFQECLPHTPIYQYGVNKAVHFKAKSEEARKNVGRALAPLDPWGGFGNEMRESKAPGTTSGMIKVSMRNFRDPQQFAGHVTASVEPSVRLPGSAGIYVHVNDHYELPESQVGASETLTRHLAENFEKSLATCDRVISDVMSLAEKF